MRHFVAEEWADFARGATAAGQADEMRRHLEAGCEDCASALKLWSTVRDVAAREEGYRPPEPAVAIARAVFRVRRSVAGKKPSRARLVFDSFRQPLPAGVRSEAAAVRQQLFSRGRFRVDTRLERGGASHRAVLLGQVIERAGEHSRPSSPGAFPTVLLYASERPLAAANANRFGEFQLEFDTAEDLRLWVVIADEEPILIRLGHPLAHPPDGGPGG